MQLFLHNEWSSYCAMVAFPTEILYLWMFPSDHRSGIFYDPFFPRIGFIYKCVWTSAPIAADGEQIFLHRLYLRHCFFCVASNMRCLTVHTLPQSRHAQIPSTYWKTWMIFQNMIVHMWVCTGYGTSWANTMNVWLRMQASFLNKHWCQDVTQTS